MYSTLARILQIKLQELISRFLTKSKVFSKMLQISLIEKCFSCYILLSDQISLSDGLYFLRYWTICALTCDTLW